MKQDNKQEKDKTEQEDERTAKDILRSILSIPSLIAIIFGALLYFWGWRYIFSYYASFGLDPIFFSFSPTDIIFSGWRVYVVVLGLVALGIFILISFENNFPARIPQKEINKTVALFWLTLALSFVLAVFEIIQYLFVFGAHSTYEYFIWAFFMLFFLYLSVLVGYKIYNSNLIFTTKSPLFIKLFRWIFPSPEIWILFFALIFTFVLSAFSSWEGLVFSKRDQGNNSRLQIATVYLNKPLEISGIQPVSSGTWLVDDLRILFKTQEMYFFFRTEEVDLNDGVPIIYAIPRETVEQILLRSWYDKFAHIPTPMPVVTAMPTSTP
jgi:hypothetical protein